MKLARFSLLFFIYSCQVFLGTPPVLLALQLLAMAIATAAVVIVAVRQRNIIFPPVFLFFFLLFFAYLSFSAILAIELAQTPLPVMQRFFQVFLTTLAAPLLAYSFWRLGMMANERILKHILLATLSYTVFKLMIVAFFLFSGVSVLMLDVFFVAFFDTAATTGGAEGTIIRFMAPADFLAPFIFYYAVVYMRGWRRAVTATIMAMGIYVTISRFIWIESAFALLMCLFTFSRGQIFATLLSVLVALPVAGPVLFPVIQHRLFDPDVSRSDSIRIQQSEALTQDAEKHFLFGHGLASYSYKMVRDRRSPYTYEEQWLALIYQLGVVGFLFLLGLLFFNLVPLLTSRSVDAIPALLLFLFSLLSGFANPSLIGRSAGVGFAFVLCLGVMIRSRKAPRPGPESGHPSAMPVLP